MAVFHFLNLGKLITYAFSVRKCCDVLAIITWYQNFFHRLSIINEACGILKSTMHDLSTVTGPIVIRTQEPSSTTITVRWSTTSVVTAVSENIWHSAVQTFAGTIWNSTSELDQVVDCVLKHFIADIYSSSVSQGFLTFQRRKTFVAYSIFSFRVATRLLADFHERRVYQLRPPGWWPLT